MALPSNYKQIAMNIPNQQNSHMMSPGHPVTFNILKERLRASGGSSERKDNSSPFMNSPHGNPAFTPQKVGKAGVTVDSRAPKPPKAPEKPLMPYMRYSRKIWDSVKAANPELKLWEIGKIIGQMWRDLPDTDKQEYIDEYETEKVQYTELFRTYQTTPEYIQWKKYQRKYKGGNDTDNHEPQRSSSKSQQQDRRIDIQPAEDEDDQDDGYSFKHVAYARFTRNHRLINDIFSDAIVPDVRSVVTTQRMHVLKRQVQSLAMHQMKLQAELQQIEEKFEAKKRKFVESSEVFQEELKKHCKPAVDDDAFQKMVERQYEALRRERLRALEEQNKPSPKMEENDVQPAAPNASSASLSEDQSSQEPMEVDGPIKSSDSDDGKSNDSSQSQGPPKDGTSTNMDISSNEKVMSETNTILQPALTMEAPIPSNISTNASQQQQPHHQQQPLPQPQQLQQPQPQQIQQALQPTPSPVAPVIIAPPTNSLEIDNTASAVIIPEIVENKLAEISTVVAPTIQAPSVQTAAQIQAPPIQQQPHLIPPATNHIAPGIVPTSHNISPSVPVPGAPTPTQAALNLPPSSPSNMPPNGPPISQELPIVPPNVTVPHHQGPPPHMPSHMGHQGMSHSQYGAYPASGIPPRAPYYMPYGGQPYQYPPYPYHQQYAPQPPAGALGNYMGRPPVHHYSPEHHGPYAPPTISAPPVQPPVPNPAEAGEPIKSNDTKHENGPNSVGERKEGSE